LVQQEIVDLEAQAIADLEEWEIIWVVWMLAKTFKVDIMLLEEWIIWVDTNNNSNNSNKHNNNNIIQECLIINLHSNRINPTTKTLSKLHINNHPPIMELITICQVEIMRQPHSISLAEYSKKLNY
jgi:hypothetical protein